MLIVRRFVALTCCLLFSTALFAAQLAGTVTNATTGKAAAGDEITLLSLNGGMQETSSARTDALGKFTLDEPDEAVEHLIRVSHGGTFYYKSVPAGSKTANVDVYDTAASVSNILEQGHVFQMQTGNGQLEVSEKYILRNESVPPVTRMGDHSFEITLPPGAQLVDSMAQGPGGLPVSVVPVPLKTTHHYGMPYPLRPGETQFRVTYKIPYPGSFAFTVAPATTLAELGVILPKSMKLTANGFTQDNDEAGMSVYFTRNVSPAQPATFSVSGEGVAPREAQEPPPPSDAPSGGAVPAGASRESSSSRWYLIGLLFGMLVGGAIVVIRKIKRGSKIAEQSLGRKTKRDQNARSEQGETGTTYDDSMLDALKEELFQLETDRLDGKISQHEYEGSKIGLDTLIRRQMKKTAGSRD